MSHIPVALGVSNDKFQKGAPIRKLPDRKGAVKTTNLTGKLISKLSLAGKTVFSGIKFVAGKVCGFMAKAGSLCLLAAKSAVGRALSGPASAVVTSLKTAGKGASTALQKAALDCKAFFVAIPGVVKENIDNLKNHMKQAKARQEAKAAKPHRQGGLFRKKVIVRTDNVKAHRQVFAGQVAEERIQKAEVAEAKSDLKEAKEKATTRGDLLHDIRAGKEGVAARKADLKKAKKEMESIARKNLMIDIKHGAAKLSPIYTRENSDGVEEGVTPEWIAEHRAITRASNAHREYEIENGMEVREYIEQI